MAIFFTFISKNSTKASLKSFSFISKPPRFMFDGIELGFKSFARLTAFQSDFEFPGIRHLRTLDLLIPLVFATISTFSALILKPTDISFVSFRILSSLLFF